MRTLPTGNSTLFHYLVSLFPCTAFLLHFSLPPSFPLYIHSFSISSLPPSTFPPSLPPSLPLSHPLTLPLILLPPSYPLSYPLTLAPSLSLTLLPSLPPSLTMQAMNSWTYDYMSEIMVCILNYLSKVQPTQPELPLLPYNPLISLHS